MPPQSKDTHINTHPFHYIETQHLQIQTVELLLTVVLTCTPLAHTGVM